MLRANFPKPYLVFFVPGPLTSCQISRRMVPGISSWLEYSGCLSRNFPILSSYNLYIHNK
jgi:hypothetical protein